MSPQTSYFGRRSDSYWFEQLCDTLKDNFLDKAKSVDVGQWHSKDIDNPLLVTREILNVSFELTVPKTSEELQTIVSPNLPWAEEHFWERVSGIPHNPPPSHVRWPWAHVNARYQKDEEFSHTYPERLWPRYANNPDGENWGIRFRLGDLSDVIDLMLRYPLTRQAYLPIWFSEDTGVVHGERVPCTLGYHFLTREHDGKFRTQVTYSLRSCDFMRYFRDDVYLAARLLQWVCDRVNTRPDALYFQCVSLHVMEGDVAKLRQEAKK